jgi:hypothetical protein
MAAKAVSTKTKARKSAAKALQASTAAVRRAKATKPIPTSRERELRRDLADFKAIIAEQNEEAWKERQKGYTGYTDLWCDTSARPPPEQPAIITPTDVVWALGGVDLVKDWLRSDETSIGRWAAEGCVAGGHRLKVYLALVDLGYTRINPTLFDMDSWEDSRLPRMRRPDTPLEPAGMEKVRHHLTTRAAQAGGR